MVPPDGVRGGIRGGRPRMRGDSTLKPRTSQQTKRRVLFVCIGNACRSQMAEAFARAYGSDVLIPASAGLAPTAALPRDTLRAMTEKNLDISTHFPKSLWQLGGAEFDLIINMSGF